MKKLFLSMMILTVVSTGAFAKRGRDVAFKNHYGNKLVKELNLTAEQSQKMDSLKVNFRTQQKALRDQYREAVGAVLTPEQTAKIKELKESKGKYRAESRYGRRGYDGRAMNLDQTTRDKLKALKENYIKERDAIDLTRITPDMQQKRKDELRSKYRDERRKIIVEARDSKSIK